MTDTALWTCGRQATTTDIGPLNGLEFLVGLVAALGKVQHNSPLGGLLRDALTLVPLNSARELLLVLCVSVLEAGRTEKDALRAISTSPPDRLK